MTLPLPFPRVEDEATQGNFDELKKRFPLSRKDIKLEDPHIVGDAGEPAFQNSWVNYDAAAWQVARFWKDATDIVWLEGLVKNGTIGQTIFTLPSGYRPPNGLIFVTITGSNVIGRIDIAPTGNVVANAGNNPFFSINCAFRRAT